MELRARARAFFEELQETICHELETLDGRGRFAVDRWEYEPSGEEQPGGGVSRVLSDGALFEKAGVNVAAVRGRLTEKLARRLEVPEQPFFATGISLVAHPLSPMIPTVHMNLRYLELAERAWFGGGADLTPYYLYEEDATHFHAAWKRACDAHDPAYYPRFKKWCDEYFWLEHRGEARGIGGIFFDYLAGDLERTFGFVQDVGRAFLGVYAPIVDKRRAEPWWDRERDWQLVRRGRYVEFNLVYDRGTLFGLETRGRTESILMSLPPLVRWRHDPRPAPSSREAALVSELQRPRDWIPPGT
jgi:coproporphyrinogen III oxidase